MKIIGSVIARLGSKRLTFKNLLPFQGVPLVRHAINRLLESEIFDEVILSTDSELIARTCMEERIKILRRPSHLCEDETPSIPVFKHIVENFPCDIHLNYNCNFPICDNSVFSQAIQVAEEFGEALSEPYAVWAQRMDVLCSYENPLKITAKKFPSNKIHPTDIHTMDDLISVHRENQYDLIW